MLWFARLALTFFFSTATAASAVAAGASIPLARVAAENSYVYAWIASEGSVTLSRPGVVIEIRAGQKSYRVGDRVFAADRAPEYNGTDLVVSPAVAATLRRIARANPLPAAPILLPTSASTATGALTVEVLPVAGRDAVAVRGRGPAGLPVTVTLTAEISQDLPSVVLSRAATKTGADGTFALVIGNIATPGRDTRLIATATSLSGVTPGVSSMMLAAPNPLVESWFDKLPQ